jgi:hypothetical protein
MVLAAAGAEYRAGSGAETSWKNYAGTKPNSFGSKTLFMFSIKL